MLNEGACDSSIARWYCGGCGSPSQTQELCSASDQKSADGAGASLAHLHHGRKWVSSGIDFAMSRNSNVHGVRMVFY